MRTLPLLILSLALSTGCAALRAEEALHRDINEAIIRLPVVATNLEGLETRGEILVTTFKPAGNGPFPLVVISHGRDSKKRAEVGRSRFESAARYFVRKGFAVAVPTRLGYGETASAGDPESNGGRCDRARYDAALSAAASQIIATVTRLREESWVAQNRLLLVGQSVGGISTVAATARNIPGLIAAVNFAGGHGGRPDTLPGQPCNPTELERAFGEFGKTTTAPMLWIYTENDRYFNPAHSRAWHTIFSAAGATAEYRLLPAFGEDGHTLFSSGNDLWQPMLDTWLSQFGFDTPGVPPRPPANKSATIAATDQVPHLSQSGRDTGYAAFLAKTAPRAFALSAQGNWGWATGTDDLLSRTLANCQKKSGNPCKLYAVNDDVVWQP